MAYGAMFATQLSLLIVGCGYISLLSELTLTVRDKKAALELDDENVEPPLLKLKHYCSKSLINYAH
jgi:hypothetical protein